MDILQGIVSFFESFPAWLNASLTVVTAASAITALTPTPRDDQWIGKIYRVVEFLAFNFGRSKQLALKNKGRARTRPLLIIATLNCNA
ncbi:MAG TPA: hypothetical protein VI565_01910 [Burkholderiales bacterium]|nr:hypothetical protein [Burkholderiales bacterium]